MSDAILPEIEPLRDDFPAMSEAQLKQLSLYVRLLADECQRQNISRYRTPQEIVAFHLLDSLEPLRQEAFEGDERCLDIGTGGGCPGLPLKIALPDISMGLLEARKRRCDFLHRCIQELGLQRTAVLHGRAESLAHSPMYRGTFDIVVARSVASLRQLVEMAIPYLVEGGEFWAYRGHLWMDELDEAQAALEILNAEVTDSMTYQLPGRDTEHALVVITALKACDARYPRSPSAILKRPL